MLIITLFIMEKGGGDLWHWRMYALYRVPSSCLIHSCYFVTEADLQTLALAARHTQRSAFRPGSRANHHAQFNMYIRFYLHFGFPRCRSIHIHNFDVRPISSKNLSITKDYKKLYKWCSPYAQISGRSSGSPVLLLINLTT